jgi:hypothetical protein
MTNLERQGHHQRNPYLEQLLSEINGILEPVEKSIISDSHFIRPRFPVLFVVGASRCGSTLLMQWLANTGCFAYPTNLLSRFYAAPYLGAKFQLLLTSPKYNYNNEILDFNQEIAFHSELGKTKGALSPNGFWYFWRRFLPNRLPGYLDEEALSKVDKDGLTSELAAIEAVFDQPLALKGLFIEQNIPFFSSLFDNIFVIFLKRLPFYNIQSLLQARIDFYGDSSAWYSVKPPEYDSLRDLSPIEQVSGQVYYTNKAIEDGLNQISSHKSLIVNYEDFCENPEQIFNQIKQGYNQLGYENSWIYHGPEQFHSTNKLKLSPEECELIIKAYKRISGINLEL